MTDLLFLIFGTAGGGLLGNAFGTLVARLLGLGMPFGPVIHIADLLEIKHPIGLGLLILGGLIGAYIGNSCGVMWRRKC